MTNVLLKINPVPKPRMTQCDRWKHRPCVDRYYDFKDRLKLLWGDREVPDRLNLVFKICMPSSWSHKKKLHFNGKPHKTKPDLDNCIKSVLDCLLTDDSGIYAVYAEKYWDFEGSIAIGELNE